MSKNEPKQVQSGRKRFCKGLCDCNTLHFKDSELSTGNPIWVCTVCHTLTKRTMRKRKEDSAVTELFETLLKEGH